MPKYAVTNLLGGVQQSVGAGYKTILAVFCGATPRRIKLKEIVVSADGSPANNALVIDVSRMTVDGTGTAVTPNALNPADPASLAAAKANYTVEPTVTANSSLLNAALNQQATMRWVADDDEELIGPATAANGFVVRVKSASYTGTIVVTAIFEE